LSRGAGVVTFPLEHEGQTYRIGPMICLEDILPYFGRKLARLHPHLLVNLTNDAWYGETSEPWEHMALSVFRAIELRTDLVRAVNSGVSAFIDANGRVYRESYAVDPAVHPKPPDRFLDEVALVEGGHFIYARIGDVFGYGCLLAALALWIQSRIQTRNRS
jgi:apolipoprotein N-acyltransferase